MKIKDLREICKLVGTNGLIDEFTISTDGHIFCADAALTFIADLKYNIELPKEIGITNVKGIDEILSKFTDDTDIEIIEDKLHISNGDKFANIPLKVVNPTKVALPQEGYEIITENIDHNIFNKLGKMRPQSLINEVYYFYMIDDKLMFRVGEDSEYNIGDIVGITTKTVPNAAIKFTMNISECFKNIVTTASINILIDKLMMLECNTEKYNIKYYLAPRVE